MAESKIKLSDAKAVEEFVSAASKCDFDIDIFYNRMISVTARIRSLTVRYRSLQLREHDNIDWTESSCDFFAGNREKEETGDSERA